MRSAPKLHPALDVALSAWLPTVEQTLLLRAALLEGDEARRSWARYQALVSDLRQRFRDDPRSRRLAPLVLDGLERNGALVDRELLTVLRTARTREELRSSVYREVLSEAKAALDAIPFLLLTGAALGETLYPSPALRHSHDIDVLVRSADRAAAHAALLRSGFVARKEDTVVHRTGLPVVVHTQLFRLPEYHARFEDLWPRSCDGHLSVPDQFVQACVHASYSRSHTSLQWACDAFLLARRLSEWDVVLQSAGRARVALPLCVAARYLAEELQASIPPVVLTQLREAAAHSAPRERDAALCGARHGGPVWPTNAGWRDRTTLVRWFLCPSPAYLRQRYGGHGSSLVLCYVRRLTNHVASRLSRRLPRPRALAPEERLLVALAKIAPTPADRQRARDAARVRGFSWNRVVDLASAQGVQPFLVSALEADVQVPAAVRGKLHRAQLLRRLRLGRFLDAFAPVTGRLAAESIPVVLLKGAALAATVYPPGMRSLNDIDLLVRRSDLDRVARILEECGFTKVLRDGHTEIETLRDYHEIVFERRLGTERLAVDVHWRIYPPSRGYDMSVEDVFREARPVQLGPVRAFAPSPEFTLVHYATQLVNDGLRVKLSRLVDLHALICSGLDWGRVLVVAGETRAAGAGHLALRLAAMHGADVPSDVLERLAGLCPGCRPATDCAVDPRLVLHNQALRTAAVVVLKPLFLSPWRSRLRALRALRRDTVVKAAACGLVITAHAWARSTQRSDLADRLRALLWHRSKPISAGAYGGGTTH